MVKSWTWVSQAAQPAQGEDREQLHHFLETERGVLFCKQRSLNDMPNW